METEKDDFASVADDETGLVDDDTVGKKMAMGARGRLCRVSGRICHDCSLFFLLIVRLGF